MFPGVDGFHWTAAHIIFLALFFAVAVTIFTTVIFAAWRSAHDLRTHKAAELCWKSEFNELPRGDRRCRHELAGRVPARICDNAFDCRSCIKYDELAALPASAAINTAGLNYPEDRLYHRGHSWVTLDFDGTVTIGLDDLAQHLIGVPDAVQLPELGSEIEINNTAWTIKKHGTTIAVRAPLEGTVLATGGAEQGWYLKLRPRRDVKNPRTLRHLLRGSEISGWVTRELERLQMQLQPLQSTPTLADGGVLESKLMDVVPDADWDTVLSDTFLQS